MAADLKILMSENQKSEKKKIDNTAFRKLDLFPSSGEGAGDDYCVGSLRKS
jgi:hypothetical protein